MKSPEERAKIAVKMIAMKAYSTTPRFSYVHAHIAVAAAIRDAVEERDQEWQQGFADFLQEQFPPHWKRMAQPTRPSGLMGCIAAAVRPRRKQ